MRAAATPDRRRTRARARERERDEEEEEEESGFDEVEKRGSERLRRPSASLSALSFFSLFFFSLSLLSPSFQLFFLFTLTRSSALYRLGSSAQADASDENRREKQGEKDRRRPLSRPPKSAHPIAAAEASLFRSLLSLSPLPRVARLRHSAIPCSPAWLSAS